MLLAYLFLAHLLGDFVFQPTQLVLYKMRSIWGVFWHVVIHFVINLIILLPFLLNGYLWLLGVIFGICFCHFWIDQAKINYDLRHDKKVNPFILDQLLHLLTILLAYFFLGNIPLSLPDLPFFHIYTNINLITFVSLIVFLSAVIEVFKFQREREKNHQATFKMNTHQMLIRIAVFTLFYGFFVLLSMFAQTHA